MSMCINTSQLQVNTIFSDKVLNIFNVALHFEELVFIQYSEAMTPIQKLVLTFVIALQ